MTMFDERESAAENKFAHDKEIEFRIHARRNRLLGLWAASRMNLSGAPADDYSKALIAATVNSHDDDGLITRIKNDLSAKGITVTEKDVREELFRVNQIAADQIHGAAN